MRKAMARIIGTDGDDTLNGTSDDDVIMGLGGNDALLGGQGIDLAVYTDGGGITVNMAAGTVTRGLEVDSLSGVERIRGSSSVDTYNAIGFKADASPAPGTSPLFNEFQGGAGND